MQKWRNVLGLIEESIIFFHIREWYGCLKVSIERFIFVCKARNKLLKQVTIFVIFDVTFIRIILLLN